jgi:heme/copper-type cytochrome/quinol oxidase subunit 2
MSMRDFAIVLALALALPAVALIVRDAVAAADRGARHGARALHVLWSAIPVLLLVVLVALAVRA